jgi:D-beta-D-heptose 7-phosphate kinase/D-beta-D-heptose 1-phosphate adenosyltransferase
MKIHDGAPSLKRELDGRKGEAVVFTNGVFDLLHPGHIELLQFARAQGDLLVVGVNDDDSVRRLKGEKRPIFPQAERLEVLAALACVDHVVPFAEDTPLELIRALGRIDVLVKGGDYRPADVVGRAEVEARGGRLCIFKLAGNYSSSALIEKIVRNF